MLTTAEATRHFAPHAAVVTEDYRVAYPTPIAFRAGDEVMLGHEDTEYPGWVWTRTPDGNEGWAPVAYLDTLGGGLGRATADYSAVELEVNAGDPVIVMRQLAGWVWVRNALGLEGWVPESNVAPSPAE